MSTLQEQFITEARELIQQGLEDLIALEQEGFSSDRVDRVFRAFHTLKGSAGIVDLPTMSLTLHAAEDVLAAIQAERLELSPRVMDCALACLDLVSDWVDAFASRGALPPNAGDAGATMTTRLRALLSGGEQRGDRPTPIASASMTLAAPDWVTRMVHAAGARLRPEQVTELVAVSYEPRADCFFNGDDPLRTMRKVPNLLAFHVEAIRPWPKPADFDPYSCNIRLQGIAATSRSVLAEIFRLVPDQVRIVDVPMAALVLDGKQRDSGRYNVTRPIIDEQLLMLGRTSDGNDLAGRAGSAVRAGSNALRNSSNASLADEIELAGRKTISQSDVSFLLAALDKARAALADVEPLTTGSTSESRSQPDVVASRSLRIDESRIDTLASLAGEVIVFKNALAHLAKRVEDETAGQDLARAIRREYDAIERLSSDLLTAILQLRLVPLSQVFRRFPRLVRDMAKRLDKSVTLVTQGETTEADKAIVDRLFDPLLHLVRNALDHGIETLAERRTSGKPDIATVTLRAMPTGRRFIVEVSDDGRGIDPNAIRRKAAERGLRSSDDLAAMPDEQVLDFIFSSGFSTAAQISDISGRGVGMDVVRSSVEQMEGNVSLTSSPGRGTTVRLDLPANIAMSRVMVVEAGGQVLGIPMDAVTETIRLTPDRISQIKSNAGFVLRDRVVPICALSELMNLPAVPQSDRGTKLLVVTEVGGKIVALEIDAIRDRLEVVLKPMEGLLSGTRGYAGTTLLGDGRVLLVLDLNEVLP